MNGSAVIQPVEGAGGVLAPLLREGVRRLIAQAIAVEFEQFRARFAHLRDGRGREAVVRNGFQPERAISTSFGPVTVRIPKVRCRGDDAPAFRSILVPRYVRRPQALDAALPWFYLHGVSIGDFSRALASLTESHLVQACIGAIGRLRQLWSEEHREWRSAPLKADAWTSLWVGSIGPDLDSGTEDLTLLVVVGRNAGGERRLLEVSACARQSIRVWREVLFDLKARGLRIPERFSVGKGVCGFREAIEQMFPEAKSRHGLFLGYAAP